ncbi:hypothetical protein ACFQV8_08965 [Pseudonocardia benzenivorans]
MHCFDVPEPTVRVVVTRLRKEGWLASRRDGRETVYLLTDAAWGCSTRVVSASSTARRARGTGCGTWSSTPSRRPSAAYASNCARSLPGSVSARSRRRSG